MDDFGGMAKPEAVGAGVLGAASFWLLLKRFLVKSSVESANLSTSDAYGEIIETLRAEVRRLGDVNVGLATALNELQTENLRLNREISTLNCTISEMQRGIDVIKLRRTDVDRVGNQDRRR